MNQPAMTRRNIVVLGASLGGVPALLELAAALPPRFPAAVLIVLHIGSNASSLPALLSARGANPAIHPKDGERLESGTLYVAPPDYHMLVANDTIQLTRGAKEHHTRPAVDPLFRSAALTYGARVIGVILTGRLDDGTAGLQAVKECGGIAVVQDPAEALEPSMPMTAMRYVQVDHCVPLRLLADTLVRLTAETVPALLSPTPPHLTSEHSISTGGDNPMDKLNAIGKPSPIACPDCHGVLWELENSKPVRYRCHTGHAFSILSLAHTQSAATEEALWSAIRALKEREVTLRRLVECCRADGDSGQAETSAADADRMADHAQLLERIVSKHG